MHSKIVLLVDALINLVLGAFIALCFEAFKKSNNRANRTKKSGQV